MVPSASLIPMTLTGAVAVLADPLEKMMARLDVSETLVERGLIAGFDVAT
jgi:hypothetical protein